MHIYKDVRSINQIISIYISMKRAYINNISIFNVKSSYIYLQAFNYAIDIIYTSLLSVF